MRSRATPAWGGHEVGARPPPHLTTGRRSAAVFQRSKTNEVYGLGHNGFFTSPDGTEDWMVHHANSSANGDCDMNRPTVRRTSAPWWAWASR